MLYLYIILIVLCVSAQFNFSKAYQKRYVKDTQSVLFFNTLLGLIIALFFFFINGCKIQFGVYTVLLALLQACLVTICHIIAVLVVKYGRVSTYTAFMMLGGMIIPFLYGLIILKEEFRVLKVVGIAVLIISLIIPAFAKGQNKKNNKLFYLLCVLVFIFNGMCCVVTKVHQISPRALDTNNFLIYNYTFSCLITATLMLIVYIYGRIKSRKQTIPCASLAVEQYDDNQSNCKTNEGLTAIAQSDASNANTVDDKSPTSVFNQNSHKNKQKTINVLKVVLLIFGAAMVTGVGYMFQLLCAKTMPASIMYPVINGCIIVLSTLLSRILFKEKITKLTVIALCVTLVGVVLFAL